MKYSLGLDIGTTSVGWAVVNEDKNRIEDLGVRIFERPENPKNGESLAKPRRDARSARRRLKRRRERLDFLKRFFIEHELLTEEEIIRLLTYARGSTHQDPYTLRSKALKEKLSNNDLFVALYHIAKRRGYKSNRKLVEETDKESGRVLSAIKENQPLLTKYDQSIAATLLNDEKFAAHKRNKDSEYSNSFIRADFEKEILLILQAQGWDSEWINELLYSNPNKPETLGKSGLFYQRPFMNGDLINKMRGQCQYEKNEPRAPKASYTFELFRLVQSLAHLEYNKGEKLTSEQIALCVEELKNVSNPKYTTIRRILGHSKDKSFEFDYIRGREKDGEKSKFDGFKFYHEVKAKLKNLPEEWERIRQDSDLLDKIGEALTINKDDETLEKALKELDLSEGTVQELIKINVSGFCHLSIKALRKLTPHLLQGVTYDKAVELAYSGEFAEKLSGDKNELPTLSEEELYQLTNPVVKRAVSQTRKVINAVIRKYGAPTQIKVECATDLARNFSDRRKIEIQQKENAEYNEGIKNKLEELGITNPTGQQIIKWKLREQQNCKCLYCGKAIGLDIFSDGKKAEIDHIIPFSMCGNDSIHNKALVCAECNQEKKDRIPFDVWGGNEQRWQCIVGLASSPSISARKRSRILCEKPPKEGWSEHALNDTRYISKFVSSYIKKNLQFAEDSEKKQRVLMPTGLITSYLRKIYGIGGKNRELNNCHHAVDACIVATVSSAQIAKISRWNKYKELGAKNHAILIRDEDGELREISSTEYQGMRELLPPWEDFAQEVRIRSGIGYDESRIEKLADFRDRFRNFTAYDEEFLQNIHPLFVSRMPKRSTKGKAHEETIRSPKTKDGSLRLTRKKLDKEFAKNYLKNKEKSWLNNSVLLESDTVLYNQIKALLEEKGEKAFDEPFYKNNKSVDKNGRKLSPVHTVKVYESKPDSSGTYLNGGSQFADNGKTVCLNIYRRQMGDGQYRYFAAPLYAHSLNKKAIPILPTPKGGNKVEKAELQELREDNNSILATSDNGFELVTQVFPNDYIKITYSDRVVEGYYAKYGIANGNLSLMRHNQALKDQFINCSLGSAVSVQNLPISTLGDNYQFE